MASNAVENAVEEDMFAPVPDPVMADPPPAPVQPLAPSEPPQPVTPAEDPAAAGKAKRTLPKLTPAVLCMDKRGLARLQDETFPGFKPSTHNGKAVAKSLSMLMEAYRSWAVGLFPREKSLEGMFDRVSRMSGVHLVKNALHSMRSGRKIDAVMLHGFGAGESDDDGDDGAAGDMFGGDASAPPVDPAANPSAASGSPSKYAEGDIALDAEGNVIELGPARASHVDPDDEEDVDADALAEADALAFSGAGLSFPASPMVRQDPAGHYMGSVTPSAHGPLSGHSGHSGHHLHQGGDGDDEDEAFGYSQHNPFADQDDDDVNGVFAEAAAGSAHGSSAAYLPTQMLSGSGSEGIEQTQMLSNASDGIEQTQMLSNASDGIVQTQMLSNASDGIEQTQMLSGVEPTQMLSNASDGIEQTQMLSCVEPTQVLTNQSDSDAEGSPATGTRRDRSASGSEGDNGSEGPASKRARSS